MNIINLLGIKHLLTMKRAHDAALKYIRGFMVTECICALSAVGAFDDLLRRGNLEIEPYAKNKNLDEKILKKIFDYLYSLKFLNKKNNIYQLSQRGKFILGYAQGPFNFAAAYAPIFHDLEALLKKQKRYGLEIKRIDSLVGEASAETEKWIPYPVVKELIKRYKAHVILDLGCGNAHFLIQLCKDNPYLYGFGIDISPFVIKDAKKELELMGIKERVELRQCDIFNISSLPKEWTQRVDIITCMFVLHEFIKDNNTAEIISLLKQIKEYFGNSYLIICELYKNSPEQLRRNPTLIAEHHLFHVLSNQILLTCEDWESIFKQIPYQIVEKIKFSHAAQVYYILR